MIYKSFIDIDNCSVYEQKKTGNFSYKLNLIFGLPHLSRKWKKDKQDILHIAICTVLSGKGFYRFIGYDEQGWPHYEQDRELPSLSPEEQEAIMREGILEYFDKKNYP